MIARRDFGFAMLAGGAFLLSGCKDGEHWDEGVFYTPYHFALTAEVETPEGLKTGRSVIEVKHDVGGYFKAKGEAVAVDLPGGQTMFVLLRSKSDVDWLGTVSTFIPDDDIPKIVFKTDDDGIGYWNRVAAYRGTVAVPRQVKSPFGQNEMTDTYPYFVRFKDIKDPKSVEQVDPDDLAKSFGAGYRLKSLTVQFTDEAVTTGIEKRLGWWATHRGMLDNGGDPNKLHDDPVKNLTKRDFKQGASQ